MLALADRAAGFLSLVGAVAIAALMVTTGIGVFFRYVLNDPINGLGDIIGLILSVCVAFSLAYGGRRGAHVAVDVLNMVGGRKVTRWTDAVVRVIGIGIIGLACHALIRNGMCGLLCAYTTSSLSLSHEPFYYLMAAGFAAYGVVLLIELVAGLAHFQARVDPSEKSN